MIEVWERISWAEDYSISNFGRVKSFKRDPFGKIVKPTPDTDGYMSFGFCTSGRVVRRKVAPVVLEFFDKPRPKGMVACHNNGIKTDDSIENLRWDTPANNELDKRTHKSIARGNSHGKSKLSETDVRLIKLFLFLNFKNKDIAEQFNTTQTTISSISNGRSWSWVEPNFKQLPKGGGYD